MNHTNYLNTRLHQKSSVRPLHSNRLVYLDILTSLQTNSSNNSPSPCLLAFGACLDLFTSSSTSLLGVCFRLMDYWQVTRAANCSRPQPGRTSSSSTQVLQKTALQPMPGGLDVLGLRQYFKQQFFNLWRASWMYCGTSSAFLAASPGALDLHVIDSSKQRIRTPLRLHVCGSITTSPPPKGGFSTSATLQCEDMAW